MSPVLAAFLCLAIGLAIGRVWQGVHYAEGYDAGYTAAIEDKEESKP